MVCDSIGILEPRIVWYIENKELKVDNAANLTTDEWSFWTVVSGGGIVLRTWSSAATAKLRFNESFAVLVHISVQCAHRLSNETTLNSTFPAAIIQSEHGVVCFDFMMNFVTI